MGVCHDLRKSEYVVTKYGFIFYFSSEFYSGKFTERVEDFINEMTRKFMIKNHVFLASTRHNLARYFAVVFYKQIEKRGFLVTDIETGLTLNDVNANSWDI